MDYVLQTLKLDGAKLAALLTFRCPVPEQKLRRGAFEYHRWTFLAALANEGKLGKLASLKKVQEIANDDVAFAKGALLEDGSGENALTYAIIKKSAEMMEYLLSVDTVRGRVEEDKAMLYALLSTLNKNWDDEVCALLINELALTEEKLNRLRAYKDIDITRILSVINQ